MPANVQGSLLELAKGEQLLYTPLFIQFH